MKLGGASLNKNPKKKNWLYENAQGFGFNSSKGETIFGGG